VTLRVEVVQEIPQQHVIDGLDRRFAQSKKLREVFEISLVIRDGVDGHSLASQRFDEVCRVPRHFSPPPATSRSRDRTRP
jgi:hypothetical protein